MSIYSRNRGKEPIIIHEDYKTSDIFENLMLLPDKDFWKILHDAAINKGILPKYEEVGALQKFEFWPHWNEFKDQPYETGHTNYVEPDVFFRFEKVDIIIEAKVYDNGGQRSDEWDGEYNAYLNHYKSDKKQVYLLAVGGNDNFKKVRARKIPKKGSINKKGCRIVKYSWQGLQNKFIAYKKDVLSNVEKLPKDKEFVPAYKRFLDNLETAFTNYDLYSEPVTLDGLGLIFNIFNQAIQKQTETNLYTLSGFKLNSKSKYYEFDLQPKDNSLKAINFIIEFWDNRGNLAIKALDQGEDNSWGAHSLCDKIKDDKTEFKSKNGYVQDPKKNCINNKKGKDRTDYYFDASEKFEVDFNNAQNYDVQVEIVSKFIEDVCVYYVNNGTINVENTNGELCKSETAKDRKTKIKDLKHAYILGHIFYQAVARQKETNYYSLSCSTTDNDIESNYYGYNFTLQPKNLGKTIQLAIALFEFGDGILAIEARNTADWGAQALCEKIKNDKTEFNVENLYAQDPKEHYDAQTGDYYFDASKLFYDEFNNEDNTFEDQVKIVAKFINEVCEYCVKIPCWD